VPVGYATSEYLVRMLSGCRVQNMRPLAHRVAHTCACDNRFVPKLRLAAECLYPLAQHPAGLLGCIAPKNAFDMHAHRSLEAAKEPDELLGCLCYVTSTILPIIPRFNAPTLCSGIGVKVCPSVYAPDSAIGVAAGALAPVCTCVASTLIKICRWSSQCFSG
jgi:hypothetical protein